MDFLGVILAALPGTLSESLAMLLGKVAELRDKTGSVPGDKLQELYDWISANASGAVTPEAIEGAVAQLIALMSGSGWGDPNQGAGGIA